jgi:hypothetical protein
VGLWAAGSQTMIGKDYFKRQASTLRKMVSVAQDRAVAARLSFLANDFEAKADDEADRADNRDVPPGRGVEPGRH